MRRPKVWLVGIGAMAAVVAVILGIAAIQEELTGRPTAAWFTPFFLGAALASFPCPGVDGSHLGRWIGDLADRC
jgi:hypothetical protein